MRRISFVPVLALALLLGACRDSGPDSPSMSGAWSGTAVGVTLSLTLNEASSGSITGTGSVTGSAGSIALTVAGNHPHPSVGLTLSAQGFDPINFSGTFIGNNQVAGTMNGSGFENFALTLTRQ